MRSLATESFKHGFIYFLALLTATALLFPSDPFDARYMSAYSMDQKVKDIDRSKYWAAQGYTFDANYMSAYSMDQKAKDIQRAEYWKGFGYNFNADYMSAYSMDNEVRRTETGR